MNSEVPACLIERVVLLDDPDTSIADFYDGATDTSSVDKIL